MDSRKIVVFSPHLDDAILSMGSLLSEQKTQSVSVISVFTHGSSLRTHLTEKLIKQAGFKDAEEYFQARKKEDIVALRSLGINDIRHLDYIDAAWRQKDGQPLYPDTTLNVLNKSDDALIKKLTSELKKFGDKNSVIYAPLARGKHIDHVIVRTVCSQVFSSVTYYSDFPYSDKFANEDEFISVHNLQPSEWNGPGYEKKKQAIQMYETQMVALFPDKTINLPKEVYYQSL